MVYRKPILNVIGIYGVINSILEVILFNLISICLSRTKNKSLIYLEIGVLLLIAFNLAHRYSHIPGNYFKILDTTWLICLVIIIFGLAKSWKQDEKIEFLEQNSIHLLMSSIFIVFGSLIFLILIIFEILISSIVIDDHYVLSLLIQNIPSILVFSYSLLILLGKIVADYISMPLDRMLKRIDSIYENKFDIHKLTNEKFHIHEINKFDKFIFKTITRLHTANRVKSDFLMHMSHDFRTPASGIYHLSRSIHNQLTDIKLKKYQKLIVDSSEQLMSYLDAVLDYSRLENKALKVKFVDFNVVETFDEIISFLLPKANEKGLNIRKKYTSKFFNYRGDKLIFHRVILNLLTNAIKFTDKGSVELSITECEIDAKKYLRIQIKDTGIGIKAENHESIFEPFYRVKCSETAKSPGIGLGLSNVRLMLKEIGGEISLRSDVGVGSTFSVFFPFL